MGIRLAMRKAPVIAGIIVLCVLTSACSGRTVIETTNAVRGANATALIDQMYRCAHDALDTSNRGSGCHRGN